MESVYLNFRKGLIWARNLFHVYNVDVEKQIFTQDKCLCNRLPQKMEAET